MILQAGTDAERLAACPMLQKNKIVSLNQDSQVFANLGNDVSLGYLPFWQPPIQAQVSSHN